MGKRNKNKKNRKLKKALKSGNRLTRKEVKSLARIGVKPKAIKKAVARVAAKKPKFKAPPPAKIKSVAKKNPPPAPRPAPRRQSQRPAPKKQIRAAIRADRGKLKLSDARKIAKSTGHSVKKVIKIANKKGKKVGKKALGKIRTSTPTPTIPTPSKTLPTTEGVKEGAGTRVDDNNNYDMGTAVDAETGIAYETFNTGQGKDKFLNVGNLPGNRFPDSTFADIKIVDYDASIKSYDPRKSLANLGIITDSKKGAKFAKYKPERQGYTANDKDFRSKEQKEDYAKRGLTEEGGRITGYKGERYKKKGKYDKILYNDNGTLQRLTLTDKGKYKPTNDSYPSEVKSNSYSDKLEIGTGLKANYTSRAQRMGGIKNKLAAIPTSRRDTHIREGKTQLSIT